MLVIRCDASGVDIGGNTSPVVAFGDAPATICDASSVTPACATGLQPADVVYFTNAVKSVPPAILPKSLR